MIDLDSDKTVINKIAERRSLGSTDLNNDVVGDFDRIKMVKFRPAPFNIEQIPIFSKIKFRV